jgi:hypothetical protein
MSIGSGPAAEELKVLSKELAVSDFLKFIGFKQR